MNNAIFKKTILLSFIGHIAIFSIFSFSFGNRIPRADHCPIAFWGAILRSSDLVRDHIFKSHAIKETFIKRPDTSVLDRANREYRLISNYYFPAEAGSRPIPNNNWREKPTLNLALNQEKMIFTQESTPASLRERKKEPLIMFYPLLPYHFLIYFKDRQVVHIELMFNIVSSGRTNYITIKRKISSGNLEADLLTMRYIGHYLFIQQPHFFQNKWQTVKIDLSTKND